VACLSLFDYTLTLPNFPNLKCPIIGVQSDAKRRSEKMTDNERYELAMKLRDGDLDRLFQRVNFFLISTAFLIGALAVLLTYKSFSDSLALKIFAILLTVAGLGLSIFFTFTNYLNDLVIRKISQFIIEIEELKPVRQEGPDVLREIYRRVKASNHCKKQFIRRFFCDLVASFKNPSDPKERVAPHTWILPFLFSFFWIVAIVVVVLRWVGY